MAFEGAKIALYLGARLVVIKRDDRPDIPFPGFWDLPGGGREAGETPFECVQRECEEELGLVVPETTVLWSRPFLAAGVRNWFMVGRLEEKVIADIVFGDEGQRWDLMTDAAYIAHPKGVPMFQQRLQIYLAEKGLGGKGPPHESGGR